MRNHAALLPLKPIVPIDKILSVKNARAWVSMANPAQFWWKWVGLVVLFSRQLLNGSQDFHFFNCPGWRIFILCEIHWDPCPRIFDTYYSMYRPCDRSLIFPEITSFICIPISEFASQGIWFSESIKNLTKYVKYAKTSLFF